MNDRDESLVGRILEILTRFSHVDDSEHDGDELAALKHAAAHLVEAITMHGRGDEAVTCAHLDEAEKEVDFSAWLHRGDGSPSKFIGPMMDAAAAHPADNATFVLRYREPENRNAD